MKKEVFMNLKSFNLKNTLNIEHLRESKTTGKRTYAGIQEGVELFLSSLRLRKSLNGFLKRKSKQSQGQTSHLKPKFL